MGRTSAVENEFEAFPGLEDLLHEIEKEEYDSLPRKQFVPQQRAAPSEPASLQVDDTVLIEGLKAAAELNGCLGVIEAWDHETSRWRVRVKSTGEAKRIKAENLLRQAAFPSRRQPRTEESIFTTRTPPDTSCGSTELPTSGRSRSAIGEKGRVRKKSRSQSRKRHDEVEASKFHRGMLVKVVNLEATPHLNGSEAICDNWDSEAKRWMVRLIKDGTLKRVRPVNLEPQESVGLRLTGPCGMLLHLDIGIGWQVKQIKEAIERLRDDYPVCEQRLLMEGQELDDNEKVSDILAQRSSSDEALDATLYRRPVFAVISGSSSSVERESREPEVAQKPIASMSTPWASIESNLRASQFPGKAPFGYINKQGRSLAGKASGKGPGRFVATRHPELAVARRLC